MSLTCSCATDTDLPLLAEWNHQLIRDEGHRNPMTVEELVARMRNWLRGDYEAVLFSDGENVPVAYALYRNEGDSIHLRQFFVRRDRRRAGIGRAAIGLLRDTIWPAGARLTVVVLTANTEAIAFWRSLGYRDHCLTLEILASAPPPPKRKATIL
ncbi:MAG: GNAT family N-acetyltransferase [Opitutaceae bacterium]